MLAAARPSAPRRLARSDRCECARARAGCTFGCALGRPVDEQPRREPDKAERTGGDECGAPSPIQRDPGNDDWRDDRADIRTGIEDSRRECALASRKPLGDRLDRRRKISGLADAERKARRAELARGCARTPSTSPPRSISTIEPAKPRRVPKRSMMRPANEKPQRVRDREPRDDVAVLLLVPSDVALDSVGARMPRIWRSM